MIGTLFGSYRVVGVIGGGGMGTIYRAEHTLIGRPAAVKVLNPEYARDRVVVTRFFNEARAATAIQHPGIVEVFDFGYQPDGTAFIVMEFLQGESLAGRLAGRGTLSETEAFAIARGIATALGAAHARGIVHRDIKPDNIFLVPEPEAASGERVKLLDFGIAKLTDEATSNWSHTRTGTVLGTPSYMAPEQCAGAGNVDHRADLYSLGCIMFEMIAGRPPFVAAGVGEVLGAHQFVPAPRLRDHAPGASREADELVAALLAKRPDERVGTATELVRLLGARAGIKATGSHHHVAVGAVGEIASTTTLGGAASPVPTNVRASRGGRWPIVAAAALALGGGGLALVLSRGPSSTASATPPGSTQAPAAVVDAGLPSPRPAVGVAALDAGLVDAAPVDAIAVDAGAIDAAVRTRPSGGRRPKPGSASPPPKPSPPELIEDL